jgi:endonuclease-3
VGLGPAHVLLLAQLPADWSAQQLYDNHEILMLHGQRVCQPVRPSCGRCALVDLCPSAVREMREP